MTKPASSAPTKSRGKKSGGAEHDAGDATPGNPLPGNHFFAEQKSLLLTERATYVQQAESLRAEAEALAEDMEPGDIQFDEESGEGDTLVVERERDLAMSAQARASVDEIDRALAKITAGTYGTCERCGTAIPKARLKALPYAALCVACKSGGLSRR
jgi:DnaK suppressor protein